MTKVADIKMTIKGKYFVTLLVDITQGYETLSVDCYCKVFESQYHTNENGQRQ